MAEITKRQGRCTNFGNKCPIADSNKVVEIEVTDDFVCPECQSDLTQIVKKPLPMWIIALIGAVVLAGAGTGIWLFSKDHAETEPVVETMIEAAPKITATEIIITPQTATMQIGDTLVLSARILPTEVTDSSILWSSTDEMIIGVMDGVAIALAKGEASIVAKSSDGQASASAKMTVAEKAAERVSPKPQQEKKPASPVCGRFTGDLKNGYPNGTGTLTFSKSRRIDLHDEKARTANTGDYIIGEWDNGHLVQGRWYDSANNLKETIVLGKSMNPERDHALGCCSK